MTIIQGAILGLVQGVAEFLPISSSAHLMLARFAMGMNADDPMLKLLDVLLHVATLLPILIYFWRDWIHMLRHPVRDRTLRLLFLASLPTLAFYLLLDMDAFDSGWFLGAAFLFTSLLLLIGEAVSSRPGRNTLEEPGIPQALLMGCMQGLALMPGISRFGATLTGGLLTRLDRRAAARFSFMMSAPAIAASLLVKGKKAMDEGLLQNIDIPPVAVALGVATVAGFIAIHFMMRFLEHASLGWFALYLALLGLAYLALQLAGASWLPAFRVPETVQLLRFLH